MKTSGGVTPPCSRCLLFEASRNSSRNLQREIKPRWRKPPEPYNTCPEPRLKLQALHKRRGIADQKCPRPAIRFEGTLVETKSSNHTYSTFAQAQGFTEHQPRNAVPPMHSIRFVCDGNTDEWLAGLVRLLSPLLCLLHQCSFTYSLNRAIRCNNYCRLAWLQLRTAQ